MTTFDCGLLWSQHAHNSASLLARRHFNFADVIKFFDELLKYAAAFFHVSQFPAAKDHGDGHFVFVFEKLARMIDLEVDIVLPNLWPNSNFLSPPVMHMRLVFVLALLLLVFVLTEIHDPANRRAFRRTDLDQVHTLGPSSLKCFFRFDDPELFTFFIDDPNGCNADLLIEPLRAFDLLFLQFDLETMKTQWPVIEGLASLPMSIGLNSSVVNWI
jgi:hypothetical protein